MFNCSACGASIPKNCTCHNVQDKPKISDKEKIAVLVATLKGVTEAIEAKADSSWNGIIYACKDAINMAKD